MTRITCHGLALLVPLVVAACSPRPARRPRAPSGPTLRVMSYNVNFGLAGDGDTLDAIVRADADAVFLQETTPRWERALRGDRRLALRYRHMVFRHAPGAGGQAVLSRFPLRVRATIPSPAGWFFAWPVIVDGPLGPLQALQVHLRPPVSDGGSVVSGYFTTPKVRRQEIERFASALAAALPTVVVGDFNEDEGGRAVAYLRRRGLRCAVEDFRPGATTWRWRTSVGTITHTLDHILYDARLRPLGAQVLRAGRSDHLPLVATFELGGPPPPSHRPRS